MFQTKDVEKIKNSPYFSVTFFFLRKSCCLCDNVEKYGSVGQSTVENITRRMRITCWISKATSTQSEYGNTY